MVVGGEGEGSRGWGERKVTRGGWRGGKCGDEGWVQEDEEI